MWVCVRFAHVNWAMFFGRGYNTSDAVSLSEPPIRTHDGRGTFFFFFLTWLAEEFNEHNI